MRGGEDGGKYPLVKADKAEKKDKQVMPKPISPANDVISLQDVTKKPSNRVTHAAHEVEASKSIDVHTGAAMAPSGKVQKSTFKINKFPAINPNDLAQNLQFVTDTESNVVFLIDTGSEISMLPKKLTNGVNQYFPPQSRSIQGIGNNIVHPIGSADVTLHLGNLSPIKHTFWVLQEPGNHGIIGLYILMSHRLTISPATAELSEIGSDRVAKLSFPNELTAKIVASVNKIAISDHTYSSLEEKCRKLVREFPEITREPNYTDSPKHNHSLEIVVDNYEPKFVKPRRCWGQRVKINTHFEDLLKRGVVKRGSGDTCASPVTCVKKKDGNIRVCVDYTRLNSFTRPLCYPLPKIDELSTIIPGGTRFFTNLDLKEAYFSLPIEINSRKYASVITQNGIFVPSRCQFGLKNAPMRFQSMMESLLRDCENFTYVYLDDILIYSKTEDEHIMHVKEVLKVISKNGLFLNSSKSTFAKPQLEFLGHYIGVDGIDVLSTKVQAIREYPLPITHKDLKRFLGLLNYYHKFIPRLAEITAPLSEISGGPKKTNRTILKLNEAHVQSFEKAKFALAEAATLQYEDHNKPLILSSDASETHVGAVLEQEEEEGKIVPLAFFSKSLPRPSRVRSVFYKELRGLSLSMKHFHSRILGRKLIIRSDCSALVKAVKNELKDQLPSEQRYLQRIKEYDPEILHIPGAENYVADALSRPPQATSMYIRQYESDPDYEDLVDSESGTEEEFFSDSTDDDEEVISQETINKESIVLLQGNEPNLIETAQNLNKEVKFLQPENLAVIVEENNNRIILPKALRLAAFNVAHQPLHLGIDKSITMIAQNYWWPTLKKDVEHWTRSCIECQAIKVTRHNKPKFGFFPVKTERFQFVHMDTVGPMDVASEDNKFILTMKDRGTSFLVTAPIPNKRAETIRNAFIQHWCGYFGIPQVIISDNGGEFKNGSLEEACKQLGIEHRLVAPYSPQSNGFVERQHRVLNQALRAETIKTNWALKLPLITVSINNTPIEGTPFTPSQYALGACVNLPGQIFLNKAHGEMVNCSQDNMQLFLNIMTNICKKSRRYENNNVYYEPTLFTCKKVWLKRVNKRKLNSLYHGPYDVLNTSEHSMHILKNGRVEKVSLKNVKAFIPREDSGKSNEKTRKNHPYNLRERKVVNYAESTDSEEF